MSGSSSVTASSWVKTFLFGLVVVALVIAVVEGLSYLGWRLAVSDGARRDIESLCEIGTEIPRKVPNTFWHHELNPEHPAYRGIVSAQGIKGSAVPPVKPAGEYRIVCVGNSTVEGTGVAPGETFPALLGKQLDALVPELVDIDTIRVINAGIGQHNSAFNLAYLAFRLIHYAPNLVIIKSAYNDYLPYLIPGMGDDYTHAFPEPFHLHRSENPYWRMARVSYFLRLSGRVLFADEVANPYRDFSGAITRDQFQRMDYSENADRFHVYAENIRSMVLVCRGRGIEVLLLDLPTSPDPDHYGDDRKFGEGFRTLIGRLEAELRRVAVEEEVPLVHTGPLEAEDFWDHCHNTAAGNRKIAERVYREVRDRLVVRDGE